MSTKIPTISEDKTIVEVDLWRCCSLGGTYLGNLLVHDPSIPGNGPWMLRIEKHDVDITFGFSTKAEGIAAINGLTRYADEIYNIDIDPTEDQ